MQGSLQVDRTKIKELIAFSLFVTVHGCRFTVHSFSINYATVEAFSMLILTLCFFQP